MLAVVQAVAPIFFLIILGWAFRKKGFPGGEPFWTAAERFIYFVLLPCLFFRVSAQANLSGSEIWTAPCALGIAILIVSAALLAARRRLPGDGPAFTSIFQGSIRFNGYVALALIGPLYGERGLAITAAAFGLVIPLVNILCIFALNRYGTHSDAKKSGFVPMAKSLFINPLVLSTMGGMAYNFLGLPLPRFAGEVFRILGEGALGFGLLAVGAGLRLQALKNAKAVVMIANVAKLILLPALTYAVAIGINLPAEAMPTAITLAALPVATSTYIMAKRMGGDADLMAGILTTQTLLSAVTIPFIAGLFF